MPDLDHAEPLQINDSTKVHRDPLLGWAYSCKDPACGLTAAGVKWHALAGFVSRPLALDHATEHVKAVRERRAVLA